MEIVRRISEIKLIRRRFRKEGKTVGFVPTMGYFHEGHLSLIRQARRDCEVVIVSIFVNPVQFSPEEDFESYPRDLERDVGLAEREEVDYIFSPAVPEMYPSDYKTFVEVEGLSKLMCGRARPEHFRGVTTVVIKLLNLIQPDIMYLGQKDAQQAIIIKKMVKELNIDVDVKILPIVREEDGLAMSSRNKYLSKDERSSALILYKSLQEAKKDIESGERSSDRIIQKVEDMVKREKLAELEYFELLCPETLERKDKVTLPILIAIAARVGKARLIDNIVVRELS